MKRIDLLKSNICECKRKKRRHSSAYYDFFYAFWITVVIDGAAILFVLSGMK